MASKPPKGDPVQDAPQVTDAPHAAAGLPAIGHTLRVAQRQMGVRRTALTLLRVNQKDGFDCPGCAWPEPDHRHKAEFCENGAKAVAEEATKALHAEIEGRPVGTGGPRRHPHHRDGREAGRTPRVRVPVRQLDPVQPAGRRHRHRAAPRHDRADAVRAPTRGDRGVRGGRLWRVTANAGAWRANRAGRARRCRSAAAPSHRSRTGQTPA